MSAAADPAHTPPSPLNNQGDAAVIDITRAGRRHTGQRWWSDVGAAAGPGPDTPDPRPADPSTMPTALAESFEETFNEHRLSLTDDRTASAYTVTLRLVQGLLDGAKAQGLVDNGQHDELFAMIQGVMGAPDLVRSAQ